METIKFLTIGCAAGFLNALGWVLGIGAGIWVLVQLAT